MKNKYTIVDGVAYVSDAKGNQFMVDADDIDRIKICSWYRENRKGYFLGTISGKHVRLHRFLLGEPDGLVDHINRNKSDNRKQNLRVCTVTESNWNRGVQKSNKIGIKGVALCSSRHGAKRYRAQINVDGKRIRLGWFDNVEEAQAVYEEAAKKYFGEFAPT